MEDKNRVSSKDIPSLELYRLRVGAKHQMTLPESVRQNLQVKEQDPVYFVKVSENMWVLSSKPLPINQSVCEFIRLNLPFLSA